MNCAAALPWLETSSACTIALPPLSQNSSPLSQYDCRMAAYESSVAVLGRGKTCGFG